MNVDGISGSPRRQKKLAPALGFRLVPFVSTLTQSEKDLHPFRFSCVMENELSLLRRDHNTQQADRRLSRQIVTDDLANRTTEAREEEQLHRDNVYRSLQNKWSMYAVKVVTNYTLKEPEVQIIGSSPIFGSFQKINRLTPLKCFTSNFLKLTSLGAQIDSSSLPRAPTRLDVFRSFISQDLVKWLTDQVNICILNRQSRGEIRSHRDYHPFSSAEVWRWIALRIHFSLEIKPQIDDHYKSVQSDQ